MLNTNDHNRYKALADSLKNLSFETFYGNFGTFFKEHGWPVTLIDIFRNLDSLFVAWSEEELVCLSQNELNQLFSSSKWFCDIFDYIINFNPLQPKDYGSEGILGDNAINAVRKIFSEKINQYNSNAKKHNYDFQYDIFSEIFQKILLHRLAKQVDSLDGSTITKQQGLIRAELAELDKRIKLLKNETTNQSIEKISEKFQGIFDKQSSKYFWSGVPWLLLSLGLSVLMYLYIHEFIVSISKPDFTFDLKLYVPYVTLASFFGFLVFQSFKTYNANRHMQALNDHKHNSIQFYEELIRNVDIPEIKQNLIKDFAQAIYKESETGFITSRQNKNPVEYTNIFGQGHDG